ANHLSRRQGQIKVEQPRRIPPAWHAPYAINLLPGSSPLKGLPIPRSCDHRLLFSCIVVAQRAMSV
ncbi:MAG: hypothetical protein JW882_19475, partial [Deltaproteobacteria bacterium]|nr:hypothetical protein [Deltaproteobacteria bacterium]